MKALVLVLSLIAVQSAHASVNAPCVEAAAVEAHKVTGDSNPFKVIRLAKSPAAKGAIYQYAFFTKENYASCKSEIKRHEYFCNSAIVDVFENMVDILPGNGPGAPKDFCQVIDSEMGDGNG